jgi:hypothetical protein
MWQVVEHSTEPSEDTATSSAHIAQSSGHSGREENDQTVHSLTLDGAHTRSESGRGRRVSVALRCSNS